MVTLTDRQSEELDIYAKSVLTEVKGTKHTEEDFARFRENFLKQDAAAITTMIQDIMEAHNAARDISHGAGGGAYPSLNVPVKLLEGITPTEEVARLTSSPTASKPNDISFRFVR